MLKMSNLPRTKQKHGGYVIPLMIIFKKYSIILNMSFLFARLIFKIALTLQRYAYIF